MMLHKVPFRVKQLHMFSVKDSRILNGVKPTLNERTYIQMLRNENPGSCLHIIEVPFHNTLSYAILYKAEQNTRFNETNTQVNQTIA